MKVLAIVLLCAFAAVQGRSAVKVIDDSSPEVALDNKPWVVHLRYAIRTSGFLQTSAGSLISFRWVLTSNKITTASFIWIRLGAKNVIQPDLVIESSAFQSQGQLGLINMNRDISITDQIAPISLGQWSGALIGETCGFGVSANGGPGESLLCSNIAVEEFEDGNLIGSSETLSEFDLGTSLVSNEKQSAVLVAVDGTSATYAKLDFDLLSWISQVTGLQPPSPPAPQPDSSESKSDSSESDSSESGEWSRVNFVNL